MFPGFTFANSTNCISKIVFSISSSELADMEGQQCALFHAILCKGVEDCHCLCKELEDMWISVSVEVLEPIPLPCIYRGTT